MNGRRAEKLYREYLLPRRPGLVARRFLSYVEDPEWLLCAFRIDDPGHPGGNDFYFWAFVQPLWVPFEGENLSFGQRFGFFDVSDPSDIASLVGKAIPEGLEFIRKNGTLAAVARRASQRVREVPGDVLAVEDLVGARLLDGDDEGARKALDRMPDRDELTGYAVPVYERLRQLGNRLDESVEAAVAMLRAHREYTLRCLAIPVSDPASWH